MDTSVQNQQDQQSTSEEQQVAVPYIPPPPPPNEFTQKKMRSPVMNGILFAAVILLGGFMTYNFVGHQLTQLAGVSEVRQVVPTPILTPTVTPLPPTSY